MELPDNLQVIKGICHICDTSHEETLIKHAKFAKLYNSGKTWSMSDVRYTAFLADLRKLEAERAKPCLLVKTGNDMSPYALCVCKECLLQIASENLTGIKWEM